MGTILAIDPGTDTGWAVFENGVLQSCGLTKPRDLPIAHTLKTITVVVENPQIYPEEREDPNRILALARKVGWVECYYQDHKVELFMPKTWKKQVPKKIHNRRTEESLTPLELEILRAVRCLPEKINNVLDAIGLGIWYTKKIGERQ